MAQATKESVLQLLRDAGVDFELIEHEPVMTADAQARAAGWRAGRAARAPRAAAGELRSARAIPTPARPPGPPQVAALAGKDGVVAKNLFLRVSGTWRGGRAAVRACSRAAASCARARRRRGSAL
jgi:hypothetical protein